MNSLAETFTVNKHTLRNAENNVEAFVKDLGLSLQIVRVIEEDFDGYYGFKLCGEKRNLYVNFPGCKLKSTKRMSKNDYSTLYMIHIDGLAMSWKIGLEIAKRHLLRID